MAHARSRKTQATITAVLTALATKTADASSLAIRDPEGLVYAGECSASSSVAKLCENFMLTLVDRGMSIVPKNNITVSQLVGHYECTDAKTGAQSLIHIEQPAGQAFNLFGRFIADLLKDYQQACHVDKKGAHHWLLVLSIIAIIALVFYVLYHREKINGDNIKSSCISLKNKLAKGCGKFARSFRNASGSTEHEYGRVATDEKATAGSTSNDAIMAAIDADDQLHDEQFGNDSVRKQHRSP